ncbi:unnamed protein product [Gordionus sp. m RMFG-2023]|uniref:uncharacterized protein LOC135930900 n=1 Tax=Gordionus sp. m RMFG-2023 TaxID=3053472 RepID=UPI0030E1D0D4
MFFQPLKTFLSLTALVCLITIPTFIESGVIIGYVPNWPLDLSTVDANSITHLLYAFVGINQDGSVSYSASDFQKLKDFKSQNPSLKIVPSIGGASYTYMFGYLASSSALSKFVSSCVTLDSSYNLDGIDIDWEYPISSTEKTTYANILKSLRAAFPSKIVMSAVPAGNQNFGGFDTSAMNKYLDYAAIMTYDYHSAGWESQTGHNSPLLGTGVYTTKGSVDEWKKVGLNQNIMVIGLPFYGRTWKLTTSNTNVGAPASGYGSGEDGVLTYTQIKSRTWQEYWDDTAEVPYAVSGSEWLSYDNEKSVTNKVQWACQNNMAGVMIWELAQDSSKSLIRAISNSMQGCSGGGSTTTKQSTNSTTKTTTRSSSSGSTSKTTTPSTSKTTTTSGSIGCVSDPSQICQKAGPVLAAYPPDCSKYVNCQPGANQAIMPCASGTIFNPNGQYCDFPYNYNCKPC